MSDGDFIILLLINLIITVVCYLLIPTIIILTGKKFKRKTLFWITIGNAVLVYLFFLTLYSSSGVEKTINTTATLLWSSVAYHFLIKYSLKKGAKVISETEEGPAIRYCRQCGVELVKDTMYCRKCGMKIYEREINDVD